MSKIGIAFIRGISMFGNKNYTKNQIMDCLLKNGIEAIMMYGNDNIIFLKPNKMHYASIGSKIEKALKKCFNEEFYVTTRSFSTVRKIVDKMEDSN